MTRMLQIDLALEGYLIPGGANCSILRCTKYLMAGDIVSIVESDIKRLITPPVSVCGLARPVHLHHVTLLS